MLFRASVKEVMNLSRLSERQAVEHGSLRE